MSKELTAVFSDEAYNDFMSGKAVDNNGLRSRNGCFYPDQPEFRLRSERDIKIANALTDIGLTAVAAVVLDIAVPFIKRFVDDKIYPFIAEKWDAWRRTKREADIIDADYSVVSEDCADADGDEKILRFDRRFA